MLCLRSFDLSQSPYNWKFVPFDQHLSSGPGNHHLLSLSIGLAFFRCYQAVCPSLSDIFYLASCTEHPSTSSQMAGSSCFLVDNVPLTISNNILSVLFTHLLMDTGAISLSWLLWKICSKHECRYLFDIPFSFSLKVYAAGGWLDHVLVLLLILKETFMLFSNVGAPIYVPTGRAQEVPFLHILVDTYFLSFWF